MKLTFTRREFKYVLPYYLLSESINYFSAILQPDTYNIDRKPYTVRSMYFDSDNFTFYTDKISGAPFRQKIRLRTYSDPSCKGCVFLEVKNKHFEKMFKERKLFEKIPEKFWETYNFSHLKNGGEDSVVEKCLYYQKVYNVKPVVCVYYQRYSFVDERLNFKVSLDFDLRSTKEINLWAPADIMSPMLRNKFVLELKYDRMIPSVFMDFVSQYGLSREPNSKYCSSVERSYSNIFVR